MRCTPNLARNLSVASRGSAQVRLGDVAKVETADQVALAGPSVVNAQYTDAGNHPASDSSAGENSAIAAGPDLATLHAAQRPALISVAIGTAVIAIIGGIRTVRRKSKNQLQQ